MPPDVGSDPKTNAMHDSPTEARFVKANANFWLKVVGIFIVTCFLPTVLFYLNCTAPNMGKTLDRVPIGSKLADLDQLAVKGFSRFSRVYEFTATSERGNGTGDRVSNEFGTFVVNRLGFYTEWEASAQERNRFTGSVVLQYHSVVIPDELNPSFQITYFYVDGRLVDKQLQRLPG